MINLLEYKGKGYHEKVTEDADGDATTTEYYREHDGSKFIDKVASETVVHAKTSGKLDKSTITVKLFNNGVEIHSETKVNEFIRP